MSYLLPFVGTGINLLKYSSVSLSVSATSVPLRQCHRHGVQLSHCLRDEWAYI
jgi:hypothetical protein